MLGLTIPAASAHYMENGESAVCSVWRVTDERRRGSYFWAQQRPSQWNTPTPTPRRPIG
jgi:hypothetical protein